MPQEGKLTYAIIHVGSSSMSLTLVEYSGLDHVKTIECTSREVTFGEELFQTGRLSFSTIREMCSVLKGYRELMRTYGVTEYRAVATSVIREAENRRNIIDQIYVQTGFEIQIIDMPREFYLKFFALYRDEGIMGLTEQDEGALFLNVTSGGLGLAVWQHGTIVYQQNLHIGTIRVLESFSRMERSSLSFATAMEEYMRSMFRPIVKDLYRYSIRYLVLSGEECRYIADLMGMSAAHNNVIISPQRFLEFYDSFNGITTGKLMDRYGMPEHWANILMPLMIIYHEVLTLIDAKSLCINHTTFREGLVLYHGAELTKSPYLEEIRWQTLQLAKSIAQRYYCDMEHAQQISRFGSKILDALRSLSGMSERSLFLFRMAAILHDIGRYVSLRNHGEQSYEMIRNLDIFGLTEEEKLVVANVVYYNYRNMPKEEDWNFKQLTEIQKMTMVKLLVIFRLARALDQSHRQKIKQLDAFLEQGQLRIVANTDVDISLERWTFHREARYFEDVYGIPIILEQRR